MNNKLISVEFVILRDFFNEICQKFKIKTIIKKKQCLEIFEFSK